MKIKLKRVYDPVSKQDGCRILVERLWPRGIKKEDLVIDAWLKDVAPSASLRKWFSHDFAKWTQFQKKYYSELDANTEALAPIINTMRKETVTLLYSSKDTEHNCAQCLKQYLEEKY